MVETAELRMSEAVPLAHALVARIAELEDVRILFIKGPTAVALGARPPRPSSDVDVLCEPGGLEKLGPALERCGWRRRVPESLIARFEHASKYMFEHSIHYIHDEWPCDLDIHYKFPGFLAPDDVVFDELWARHTTVEVAHWPVPCADFFGQAAVVALHALRDGQSSLNVSDISFVTQSFKRGESQAVHHLAVLAAATGSTETLAPLLANLGVTEKGSAADPELLRRWRIRQENAGTFTTPWLIELRERPWRAKPGLIWRAALPPGDELLSAHVGMPRNWRSLTRLHLRRWQRAARHLGRGIAASRRARNEVGLDGG